MDDTERRLSESASSSSDEGSSGFERATFGSGNNHGFEGNILGKRRRQDDSLHQDDEDESSEEPKKKKSTVDFDADEKAQRMMEKMGYKKGIGLGKHGQGRLEPVEASDQKGRRGLGHYNEKLTEAKLRWNPKEEIIKFQEDMEWLENTGEPPDTVELEDWMKIGARKLTIEDETQYCEPEVIASVVSSKSVFDNLDKNEMRRARTRSNPYETIRGAFFLNRAAVKMANIDKACEFIFTKPKILNEKELLYFADVCAGPGGFSEYVLWKKKWFAKGFGFTLRETNDFKLEDFYAGTPETFHPFYGPKENGDVYDPENQESFRKLIMHQTAGKGVHFMMSDGGFSVEGQESVQEILSKQLYLCQCLVALMIVREDGNFVTKVFDLFTPFSAGLVYIMYRCFKRITIFKPNTSRPANSERYLICEGKKSNVRDVIDYLSRVNVILLKGDPNRDVIELVSRDVINDDLKFFHYLKNSNDELGKKQILGLSKIAAFCEDTRLTEDRQAEMKKKCLEHWELPDKIRTRPLSLRPDEHLKNILNHQTLKSFTSKATTLTRENVSDTILKTPYDWFCVPCGSGFRNDHEKVPTFYMGTGRTNTYRYNNGIWEKINDLELPPETLVYAELADELRGEFKAQRKTRALHIIDAYLLGGEDVSQKYIQERYELTKLFAEALWKPAAGSWIRVRAKELHPLANNLQEKLKLKPYNRKNHGSVLVYAPSCSSTGYDDSADDSYVTEPNSILFLKGTARNWSRQLSRTSGCTYYFNSKNGKAYFDKDRPSSANASFFESFENRILWEWPIKPSFTVDDLFTMIRKACSQTMPNA